MSLRRSVALVALGFSFTTSAFAEDGAEGVVVHDEPLSRASRRDKTAASTVIKREALARPGADAASVLATVPGVQVARAGSSADFATASLRGATSAQTPIYLAGIRLNDDVTGTADLSRVPLFMLDRVEVFRGSAPEDVDRMGIGGAIVFSPRLPQRTSLGGGAGVGSFGERFGWVGGAVRADGASSLVAVRREHADNDFPYLDDRGTAFDSSDDRIVKRQNADADSWDVWAIGQSEPAPGVRVTTVLNGFDREQGVPGLGAAPALHSRAELGRLLGGVSARAPCAHSAPGEEPCTLELSQSLLTARQTYRDPLREVGLPASEVSSRGTRSSSAAHLVLRPSDAFRIRAGGGHETELLHIASSGLSARREVERADASLHVAPSESLELGLLGALECHGTTGPGSSAGCGTLAPAARVGASFAPAERVTLLANAGRYVRVPTLGELYGQSAVVLGNAALSPERGITADVGARASAGDAPGPRVAVDLFGFVREASDLVAYRRSNFNAVRPYNIGRARVLGLELAAAADALRHLRLDVAVTLSDPRDITPNRQLGNDLVPFQSRLVENARLELYHQPSTIADRIALGVSSSYRASRVADPAGLVILGEQWLFGLDASALLWKRRLTLRAAVDDLFDARQLDSVGYPLPGRSYHASAELWW